LIVVPFYEMKNSKGILLFLFTFLLFSSKVFCGEGDKPKEYSIIRFTENKNQWDKNILYRAQLDGGVLFLEKNCFTYSFYDKETLRKNHAGLQNKTEKLERQIFSEHNRSQTIPPIRSHAFRMTFVNAETSVETSAKQPTPDYCNYFIGNDESKWAGNVKNYNEVYYTNIYKHVNLQLFGLQNSIKYNFFVSPQGNTNDIQLFYEGLEAIELNNGTLKLKTSLNELVEQRPYAYQQINNKQIEVPCEFVLEGTTVHFNFPEGYDKSHELVIDPILVFAASSGSTADNFGMTATYDTLGNLYSGGTAFAQGYPTTLGAYDTTYNGITQYGRTDVVITKYNSTGTTLLYSTYLGGAIGSEIVTSLVVNAQDELLLYGATGSSDFPHTSNAFDTTFNGGSQLTFLRNGTFFNNGTDIYVAKLSTTGNSLLASTYIGGNQNDGVNYNNTMDFIGWFNDAVLGWIPIFESPADSLQYNYGDQFRGEINVDTLGNVYIASSTRSSDFPFVNGFDSTLGGQQDAIALKLNSDLSQILWSTYLGGSDNDAGYALALDDSSNVYITGGTRSAVDFPITTGALQTTYNGGKADGYITRIKNDGSAILQSTLWGTTAYDQTYFVQLDKNKDVYVVGQTEGAIPITAGVYNNPNSGQFITKMNDSLNTLLFSTVFGNGNGQPNISPSAFLVDQCKNIYVSGWGGNIITGIPTTGMPLKNPEQPTTDGFNFYLIVLSPDAALLLYATYFGGPQSQEHVDGGTSRFDKRGIIYQSVCAGCGGNDDFPVTPGAWPNTGANVNHSTNCNNGVFKFDFQIELVDGNFIASNLNGCPPLTINLNYDPPLNNVYLWDFGNGTSSTDEDPTVIYNTPGTYTITLSAFNPCSTGDTTHQYVTVYPPITADFNFTVTPCSNDVSFSDASAIAPVSWLWLFNDGDSSFVQNPQHTYPSLDIFDVELISSTINGCKDTVEKQIDLTTVPVTIGRSTTICKNNNVQLNATGGVAYSWSPTTSLSNANIASPIANPDTTTTYTVNIVTVNALGDTCIKALTTTVNVIDFTVYTIKATADKDTIFEGQSTVLHAITNPTSPVSWSSSSGESFPNLPDITIYPKSTTTYTASVIAAQQAGCPILTSIRVEVIPCQPSNIFIPNTFTPNGDGNNDVLYVRGDNITELYFAVYNRWGQIVFETKDITKGWNGIYDEMKSDPVVFAWYLRAKCYNGEAIEKKGNVTLIR
jgi:gliding motility-associated-like protein